MPRILLTAAVAVAAAVAVPSAAHGATVHNDGRSPHRILLQDERGETNLVSVEGTRSVVIHDLNAPITVAGVPTCMPLDANTVSCARFAASSSTSATAPTTCASPRRSPSPSTAGPATIAT
jgi:hypothetical protein